MEVNNKENKKKSEKEKGNHGVWIRKEGMKKKENPEDMLILR